jgi:chemotaxis protein CheD
VSFGRPVSLPSGSVGGSDIAERLRQRVAQASGQRHVVGIGELAVSGGPNDLIVTHALGSCIAVCLWDPVAGVAGLLHYLLPDSKINLQRAQTQPGTYADTGIPLLLQQAYAIGALKSRTIVRLVGGAEVVGGAGCFNVGKRNLLAARNLLWRHGLLIKGEAVGGTVARTVHLDVSKGRVRVTSGSELLVEL